MKNNRKIERSKKMVQKLRYYEPKIIKIGGVKFNHWKPRQKALTRKQVIEKYNIEDYI